MWKMWIDQMGNNPIAHNYLNQGNLQPKLGQPKSIVPSLQGKYVME